MTPGAPVSEAPITFRSGHCRCTTYQMDGNVRLRCGSLQSSGLPVAVLLPLTAQLLLPMPFFFSDAGGRSMSSEGNASGTVSSLTGGNFQPPGLDTIGSPVGFSKSKYSR